MSRWLLSGGWLTVGAQAQQTPMAIWPLRKRRSRPASHLGLQKVSEEWSLVVVLDFPSGSISRFSLLFLVSL